MKVGEKQGVILDVHRKTAGKRAIITSKEWAKEEELRKKYLPYL